MKKKILLAADGSESSIRAAEHLSFMAGQSPVVSITLFHVDREKSAPGVFAVEVSSMISEPKDFAFHASLKKSI